jgi:Tfp pilus assembly protein PilF
MHGDNSSAQDVDYAIDTYLQRSGEGMRAWIAYGRGDFSGALDHYAKALSTARDKAGIRLDRGRILAMQGKTASAVAEFQAAIEEMRTEDKKDLVVFYNSKALAEYSIAVLEEGAGDAAAAHEAYGRALQEDLAFYPAHIRLGLLALGAHDTTTAMSELALAAQIAPNEPHVRYLNGYVLIGAHHYAEASGELKAATELEPYYALPYFWLGRVSEQLEKGPEALAAYEKFLERASRSDAQREVATERRDELKEMLAVIPQKP